MSSQEVRLQILAQRFEAGRMLFDEGKLQDRLLPRANGRIMRFENELHHALQGRDVAADADLAIFAGDPGRA